VKFLGVSTPLDVTATGRRSGVSFVRVVLEQGGVESTIVEFDRASALPQSEGTEVVEEAGVLRLRRTITRETVPGLASGPARLIVVARRPVLAGVRQVESRLVRDVEVRLERPRVTVLSTHHYVNHGGAEAIVYRVQPADVASGVRVGDLEYPGYPLGSDPAVRVAFFALLHDQELTTPMRVFARDEAGNRADADFDRRTFPKPVRQSRIELPDAFIDRVVPAILESTTEIAPTGTTLEQFVAINGELRQKNNATIASFAQKTDAAMLWTGEPFYPFTNTAVQSAFADARTYLYQGREVDRQTHLGFDLASYAGTAILAGQRGRVLFADMLGIYGNTVIIDHGMGVQSLYAHLSSLGVQVGDMVEKAQEIGRSGMTGLAGGDHLHFTMLVAGRMVNPIEWWDPKWIEDRIMRKLREAR
jgi:murein DD-endopeptidase MepM/ murein hydrolase activator NlpD